MQDPAGIAKIAKLHTPIGAKFAKDIFHQNNQYHVSKRNCEGSKAFLHLIGTTTLRSASSSRVLVVKVLQKHAVTLITANYDLGGGSSKIECHQRHSARSVKAGEASPSHCQLLSFMNPWLNQWLKLRTYNLTIIALTTAPNVPFHLLVRS